MASRKVEQKAVCPNGCPCMRKNNISDPDVCAETRVEQSRPFIGMVPDLTCAGGIPIVNLRRRLTLMQKQQVIGKVEQILGGIRENAKMVVARAKNLFSVDRVEF